MNRKTVGTLIVEVENLNNIRMSMIIAEVGEISETVEEMGEIFATPETIGAVVVRIGIEMSMSSRTDAAVTIKTIITDHK